LDALKDTFEGSVKAHFQLTDPEFPLTIDYIEGEILSIEVNGKRIAKPNYNKLFITLTPEVLKNGKNTYFIEFSHAYSKTGAGFYKFTDPEDKETYLYSNFEPYNANRLFPCFDQPDLKAEYTLKVSAPKHWEVISSVLETHTETNSKDLKVWTFPKSKKFSTYLFPLIAGPYSHWSGMSGNIPLRLFARKSLAKHVLPAGWFKVTDQGFKFFNEYFGIPYPFAKYDQILVPDFNWGGMENVAAVTFSESLIVRGKRTQKQKQSRAGILLHEMAHMWFGNLVTMKWWDDLWLNESFASYMGALSLYEATEFTTAWESFLLGTKRWGYWEDQLITTHPIEASIPGTEDAFSNFDGITYGKGASVLKQISYFIGPENFKKGVNHYFKKHSFSNAKRADFISALEISSKKDLQNWTKEWLQTAGLNSIQAQFKCDNDKISSFELHQNAIPSQPTLRSHQIQIALLSEDSWDQLSATYKTKATTYEGKKTIVKELIGQPCPKIVLPNFNDHDYIKVVFDPTSLNSIKQNLSSINGDLDRALIWMTLWSMVQDAKLSVLEYLDLVIHHLPKEHNFEIATRVLYSVYGSRTYSPSSLSYLADNRFPTKVHYDKMVQKLETFFWTQLENARPGSDFQKLWFDSYVRIVQSPKEQNRLALILDGKKHLPKWKIDQDRRWKIITQLNRHAAIGSFKRISKELKEDSSRRANLAALGAKVIRPEWKFKKPWIKKIVKKKTKVPLAELRVAMQNIFPMEQRSQRKRFSKLYYKYLLKLVSTRENTFINLYTRHLVPSTCKSPEGPELTDFIDKNKNLPPVAIKKLRIARQENDRCISIRKLAHVMATKNIHAD